MCYPQCFHFRYTKWAQKKFSLFFCKFRSVDMIDVHVDRDSRPKKNRINDISRLLNAPHRYEAPQFLPVALLLSVYLLINLFYSFCVEEILLFNGVSFIFLFHTLVCLQVVKKFHNSFFFHSFSFPFFWEMIINSFQFVSLRQSNFHLSSSWENLTGAMRIFEKK